jgi:hypothetical protein
MSTGRTGFFVGTRGYVGNGRRGTHANATRRKKTEDVLVELADGSRVNIVEMVDRAVQEAIAKQVAKAFGAGGNDEDDVSDDDETPMRVHSSGPPLRLPVGALARGPIDSPEMKAKRLEAAAKERLEREKAPANPSDPLLPPTIRANGGRS